MLYIFNNINKKMSSFCKGGVVHSTGGFIVENPSPDKSGHSLQKGRQEFEVFLLVFSLSLATLSTSFTTNIHRYVSIAQETIHTKRAANESNYNFQKEYTIQLILSPIS